jgi:hypothetical protein
MRLYDVNKSVRRTKASTSGIFYGKVVSVNYDKNTPDKVGSIEFKNLTDVDFVVRGEAYPMLRFMQHPPLVDEIVLLVNAPSEQTEEGTHSPKVYYLTTVNIWNHPHHSAITETKQFVELDSSFSERTDINPMFPYSGDVILEGRLGQSIRFSQTIPESTPWSGSVQGAPLIVISNGQSSYPNGFTHISEDINLDDSSIYLTSKQGIPLRESQQFTQTSYTPTSLYDSSQVIINSGRLVFNSKSDSITLTATSTIGIKGIVSYIEGTTAVNIDAPRINLGQGANQQAVLGNALVNELTKLYEDLKEVLSELGVLASTLGYAPMIQTASTALTNTELRQNQLASNLLSNKTYLSK